MRVRLPIALLLLLVLVVSACSPTPTTGPSPIPQIPPAEAPDPADAAEPEGKEDDAAAPEAAEQDDSSQAADPGSEAVESSDTGPLSIAECVASPDMYTLAHTVVSKEEGSRGWTCQDRLIIRNTTSNQPLLLDYHLDHSAGTYSLGPWVKGEVTPPTATPKPDGTLEEPVGAQVHEWLHPRMVPLAPGRSFQFDGNLTAYDNGLYTYKQITRILLRRNLAGCIWFTPDEAQFDWVDILTPCLGASASGGG